MCIADASTLSAIVGLFFGMMFVLNLPRLTDNKLSAVGTAIGSHAAGAL